MNLGIQRFLRKKVLRGSNVHCPCCNSSFSTFLPVGKPVRFNAGCPNCYSFERHRLLWLFLFSQAELLKENMKLLHVAPERVFFKKFQTLGNLLYIPADKFMPGYKYPKGTKNMDITAVSYPDNHFDAIICSHVLEHVPNDKRAMQELHRVLHHNGWAILQVPIDYSQAATFEDNSITSPEEREKYFGQHDHLRLYGRDYAQRLQQAGFKVEEIDYYNTFSKTEKEKFGLSANEGIIYFCRK